MGWIHHLSQAAVTWQEQEEARLYQALAWALVAVTLDPLFAY